MEDGLGCLEALKEYCPLTPYMTDSVLNTPKVDQMDIPLVIKFIEEYGHAGKIRIGFPRPLRYGFLLLPQPI